MKKLLLLAVVPLAGCAMSVTMMPRDSGKTFSGEVVNQGDGRGTMSVTLDGDTCSGPMVRVASNQTFGLVNSFGANNRGTSAIAFGTVMTDGDVAAKALLSCTSGKGIRCDMTGRSGAGGGICVDDAGRVYDVLMVRK